MLFQSRASIASILAVPEVETTASPFARLSAWVGRWQPFTGGGVASFARASSVRLFAFQSAFALVGALAMVLALRLAWLPPVEDALLRLPEADARIRWGRLTWPAPDSVLLGERPQFSIGVTPTGGSALGQGSDVQFDLRPGELRIHGLLGFAAMPYPPNLDLPLTRTGGQAAWDAWRSPLLIAAGILTLITLLILWWLQALIYALPAWGLAAIAKRSPGAGGAWKLCSAALLPATLILLGALLLYAVRAIPPTGLAIGGVISIVAGWCWILWAITKLPASPRKPTKSNPFNSASEGKRNH